MRVDIDARFLPFSLIIWTVSLLTIIGEQVFISLVIVVVLISIYFRKLNIVHLFVIFVAFLSSFSRTLNTEIPNLSPGVPVIMEVKVISDLNKNRSRNIGIYRQEESNFVVAKSFRLEEVGVINSRKIQYKSKIKLEFSDIHEQFEFGTRLIVKGKIKDYKFQNIAYRMQVDNYFVLKQANVIDRVINQVRRNFLKITTSLLGDARELLPGLILGDTRNQSLTLNKDMKNSGLPI